MPYGTTLNSTPLTDDNSVWPEDQPPAPQPQPSPYYWVNLAKSLWSGATLPGDVATGKASMADPATQRRVMDMTGTVMGGGLVEPAEADALNSGFRLFHGTKTKFEQPSNEFINTGQGAQSYGWGHYGAQAEPVALDMRDQLSGPHGGHMQEWEVNADPEHFLDWDYTLGDQSKHVSGALEKSWPDLEDIMQDRYPYRNATGREVYHWLTDDLSPQEASEELLSKGIPGIRYMDQVSRLKAAKNLGIATPDATRNFVLPDPSIIKVKRYYNAAGVPMTFGNALDQPGETP